MSDRAPLATPHPRPDVAILGLGASGLAAARLAHTMGETVYVSETRTDASTTARRDELAALGVDVELGGHDLGRVAAADTVVVSPGIAPHAPLLRTLHTRGVRWISEPEFAFRFFRSALIAVTGTNGKTTTSVLLAHLLDTGGVRVALGGNIGSGFGPAASDLALLDPPPDWLVVEVSSFQLAWIERFRPDIGVVTNLAPDHLDRYPDVASYYADKRRLFETATEASRWVLNGDDRGVEELARDAAGERYLFTLRPGAERALTEHRPVRGVGFVRHGRLVLRIDDDEEELLPVADLPILGRHNQANALAAALAARLAGVAPDDISSGLRSAEPLPHRLEPVAEKDGVLWVNDSKATNVAATVSAVRSLEGRPLVLLVGGKDKGESLDPLREVIRGRCKAVLAYGAAGARIATELSKDVPGSRTAAAAGEAGSGTPGPLARETEPADGETAVVERLGDDFGAVVRRAAEVAAPGDVVLLAPACSSFDMFDDYEARGRRFQELVAALLPGAPDDGEGA